MAVCGSTCYLTCYETCSGTCEAGCRTCVGLSSCFGGCYTTCEGTCDGVCRDDCTGTCKFLCGETCSGTCEYGCLSCAGLSSCRGSCLGTCTATCADDCTGGAYMTRPADFTGFTEVYSGAPVTNLTASDWNAFNNRLIAFAHYKGKKQSIGTFSSVSVGDNFTAAIYNRTVQGLSVLSSYITTTMPTNKSSGQEIYASYIQALKNALNSID